MKTYSLVDILGFSASNRVLGMFSDWFSECFSAGESRLPITSSILCGDVDSIS